MGRLELRCTDADLSSWKSAAEARGLSLSRFVRDPFDEALGEEPLAGASPEAHGTPSVLEPVVVSGTPDPVPTRQEEVGCPSLAPLSPLPVLGENDDDGLLPPAFPPTLPARERGAAGIEGQS
jgi:hypothetical protein